MNLFERVDKIIEITVGSRAKFAKRLGFPQTTFNGYFAKDRQNNLWPILPNILKEFPNISRDWLYFEEGSPEASPGISGSSEELIDLLRENRELRKHIDALEAEIKRGNLDIWTAPNALGGELERD
jgi:hypothetical protein